MRKFIITSTDLDYMFELFNTNQVRRVATKFDEQELPPLDDQMVMGFAFPREVAYRIVKEYLKQLMREAHFDLAFELLCLDRFMISQMYYAIYGISNLSLLEKIKRLSWTFRACMEFYDFFLCSPNLNSHDFFAIALEYYDGWNIGDTHTLYPWNFELSTLRLIAIEPPLLEDGNWNVSYHVFHPGRNYGDTVWLQGHERKGIFRAVQFMRPVITVILQDGRNRLLSIARNRETMYFFHRFAQFLNISFGKDTRVFFAVDAMGNTENMFQCHYLLKDALKCMI